MPGEEGRKDGQEESLKGFNGSIVKEEEQGKRKGEWKQRVPIHCKRSGGGDGETRKTEQETGERD